MKRISRGSLQSEIIENIIGFIVQNNLKNGDSLPSQMEMTKLLGISKTSLREALKTLEAHGIIEIKNGKGVYVKDTSTRLILSGIEKERESLLEAIEARRILENEIIRLLVLNATDEELERLQAILDAVLEKHNRHENASEDDRIYHMEVYKTCHNAIMTQLAVYVGNLFKRLWENPMGIKMPFADTMPNHKLELEYIRKRDYKKAQTVNNEMMDFMIRVIKEREK